MDYELVIVRGRSGSQTLKLADGVTTVGRHDDCQLRIKSSQVSRRHCEIFEKKGLLLVKDLGSANGTFVNGKKIDGQRVLEPGDELMVGQVKLRVARAAAAASPTGSNANAKPGRPGDTAVAAVPAGASSDLGDEFEIEFGEPPAADEFAMADDEGSTVATPAPSRPRKADDVEADREDAVADFLLDFPVDDDDVTTPAAPASSKKKPAEPAKAKAKAKAQAEPEPAHDEPAGAGDDAIADFLLDIKLDDEDE